MTDEELNTARQKYAAMSLTEKKSYYEKLVGIRDTTLSETILDMAVEYELQAMRYGDLTKVERERLASIGQHPEMVHHASQSLVLRREYKGNLYEVEQMPDGKFRFQDRTYLSLSAIANEITGSHTNGRRFFSQQRIF